MRKEEKKQIAFIMYVENNMDAKTIAATIGVGRNTMSRWIKYGDWQDQRAQKKIGATRLSAYYYQLSADIVIRAMDSGFGITPEQSATIHKLAGAIQKLERNVTPALVTRIINQFNIFLYEHDPVLAEQMAPMGKKFVSTMLSKHIGDDFAGYDKRNNPAMDDGLLRFQTDWYGPPPKMPKLKPGK